MKVANRIGLAVLCGLIPHRALADHDHGGGHAATSHGLPYEASVQLVGARFDTMSFLGDYQGLVPATQWTRGRLGASVSLGLYRLTENGRVLHGIGDAMLAASVTGLTRGSARLGISAAVSLPTGDHNVGLGMGHLMVMPSVWGSWMLQALMIDASLGYAAAIGGDTHHDHGAWPLVAPMNPQELTWSGSALAALGKAIHAGIHASGGVAIGAGQDRVVIGARAIWTAGRFETVGELQTGLVGDPFTIRGVLATAVHF